jgi:hypothetical protein
MTSPSATAAGTPAQAPTVFVVGSYTIGTAVPGNVGITVPAATELRFGYTLDSLTRLAHHAARKKIMDGGTDLATKVDIAWGAIAEYLYAAEEPPTPPDLIHAGLAAIGRHRSSRRQFLGLATDGTDGTHRGFERYWSHFTAPTDSPEDKIIERLALAQIWPRLTRASREALVALATCGDYQQAADALGLSYRSYVSRISEARRQFLALWHDGEKPSRPWVRDRRSGPGTDMHSVTYFLRSRRLRSQARIAAKDPVQ